MKKPGFIISIGSMIDKTMRPLIIFLYRLGITANMITFLQVPFVILMFSYLIGGLIEYSMIFLAVSLFLDLFDGMFARITDTASKTGQMYDKILDVFGIFAFLVALTIYHPSFLLISAALGLVTILLYISNFFIEPEVYCGVRTFGLFGMFLNQILLLLSVSLIFGFMLLFLKFVKLLVRYAKS